MFSEIDGHSFPKTQTNTAISEVVGLKKAQRTFLSRSLTYVFRTRISIKEVLKHLSCDDGVSEGTKCPISRRLLHQSRHMRNSCNSTDTRKDSNHLKTIFPLVSVISGRIF